MKEVCKILGEWYRRLDLVQARARERLQHRSTVLAIARQAAIKGKACTDRLYLPVAYQWPAWATEIVGYRDSQAGVVRVTSYRRQCGWIRGGPYFTSARMSAKTAEYVTREAPGLPVSIASRLTYTGLPEEAFALYIGPHGCSAQPYDLAGRRLCRAWALTGLWRDSTEQVWVHARTRREAHAEAVRIAESLAWEEDRARREWAAYQEEERRRRREEALMPRKARLLARLSTTLSASWADAISMGYCESGVREWATEHGIADPETARVPLRMLVADENRRARALALEVARQAILAAGR